MVVIAIEAGSSSGMQPDEGCNDLTPTFNSRVFMLPKIHLLACHYEARCTDLGGCTENATVLARWIDDQGQLLRQRELCEDHAQWLKDWVLGVSDLR